MGRTTTHETVVGALRDRDAAQGAVDELRASGFHDEQIGFAMRGTADAERRERVEGGTDVAGRAMGGAASGGLLGGLLGAAAALIVPGIGPVVAGGVLKAAFGGAAAGAAAGGLLGALTSGEIPGDQARYYEGELRAGRIILAVRPDGRAEEATDILRRHGAYYARVPEGEPPERAAEEVADDVPIGPRST
jgi:hypothetical protein